MTILISFVSSIIAAFLAHFLATTRSKKSELLKFQIQSYSDFLSAASRLAVSRRLGSSTNENVDLVALNDAKSRIITCGNVEVVEALIHFWDKGGTLEREQEILAYKNLTQLIRSSLGHKKHDMFNLKISDTLFKLEPSSFSFRANEEANKSIEDGA
ncbi:hypothetical protein ACTTBA_12325 [Shewanella frigidimarina]|jgi:hypothetical protein|uniref:hypothetical protein n=1 Tax=Shewanella TaxID=22 RepID=UPI0016028143|nr:hypothetical protein [Shewanella sp. SG44-2]MBB1425192.1 hypothetical protein [Shewanella sp. SG44-2]